MTTSHPRSFFSTTMDSPIGALKLIASNEGLAAILWRGDNSDRLGPDVFVEQNDHPILCEARQQLEEYFAGTRKTFTVPLDATGTPFQRRVWKELLTIPYGQTRSYGQIARQIGHAAAMRAVGAANGKNPIPIIVPCHRVIGSTGELTGFGGGIEVKAYLLSLETGQIPLGIDG